MKRVYKKRKKSNLFLLIMLVLGISVGFALLSQTLNITGLAGIKKNTWDIHWENVQPNAASTVTTETPVISDHATKVTYAVNLEKPGDFYEFDVDAKNDGTLDAQIILTEHNVYGADGETADVLPSYINYSIFYKDTEYEPVVGDILHAGEKQTYTIRIEYDPESEILPDEDSSIKIVDEVTYGQVNIDPDKYKIQFNPNGGSVGLKVKDIEKNSAVGLLPVAEKDGAEFEGWYTKARDGEEITAETVPEGNTTYYAHWDKVLPIFDKGSNVNKKLKT